MASALGGRILYLEQDATLLAPVSRYLESYGFQVVGAERVAEARDLARAHEFEILLLDLDGQPQEASTFLRDVAARAASGIIVTSGSPDEEESIRALETGADYYLPKPFNLRALVAHLRALHRRTHTRRASPRPMRMAHFGHWSVDLAAHRAECASRAVDLTAREVGILRVLLERPHHVFSRAELLASTRQSDGDVFDRTIDVLISRLRQKLEATPGHPELIQTVRSGGYVFAHPVEWVSSD